MTAWDRCVARFGGPPRVQCWSPTAYRVRYAGWHAHNGAASGAPFADGDSLEAACEALLRYIDQPHVELVEGDCDQSCMSRYLESPKYALAHGRLLDFLRKL